MCKIQRDFLHSRATALYDHFMKMRDAMLGSVVVLALAGLTSCTTPLQKVRSENQMLSAHVDELRAERREQDRKMRDLQRQMQMLQQSAASGPALSNEAIPMSPRPLGTLNTTPHLAVTVMTPLATDAAPAGDSDLGSNMERTSERLAAGQDSETSGRSGQVVGTTDDGTEIVYENEATQSPAEPTLVGRVGRVTRLRSASRPASHSNYATSSLAVASSSREGPSVAARLRAPLRPLRARERTGDAASTYREAVALLRRGEHAASITMLRAFVTDNPQHEYADNAQYWLGEAFYDQKDYTNAVVQFRAVLDKFPQGNKVPDSMLKIGYCYFALGNQQQAQSTLQQLISSFPTSEPASLAMKRLESK
jgi:tol-pal system protein YbgF